MHARMLPRLRAAELPYDEILRALADLCKKLPPAHHALDALLSARRPLPGPNPPVPAVSARSLAPAGPATARLLPPLVTPPPPANHMFENLWAAWSLATRSPVGESGCPRCGLTYGLT